MDADIAVALERFPRLRLATLPTPLHELRRLRDALGGDRRSPRILVKRDDLTGLAGGGTRPASWSSSSPMRCAKAPRCSSRPVACSPTTPG
jgi:hypothetical protein